MKFYKSDGFSLIEVMLSILILGIIIISFSALFLNGYRGIFTAGKKSSAVARAEELIVNEITESVTTPTQDIIVIFPDENNGEQNITVTGRMINIAENYYDSQGQLQTVYLYYFKPGD